MTLYNIQKWQTVYLTFIDILFSLQTRINIDSLTFLVKNRNLIIHEYKLKTFILNSKLNFDFFHFFHMLCGVAVTRVISL